MNKINKAFTLVELIVVITILAILGTIAFLAFQGYSKTARDSRRVSDIGNIKTALELFILNTGKYPLPDNGEEVSYSGDTLWTQGTVGDNVITNLSETLKRKPLDPLLDIEYTYSTTYSKKEYQVMALYEGELSHTNNLINTSYAANIYKIKIEGTYNEIFVKSQRFIVPTPSIINAEVDGSGIILNNINIKSQVITGGTNFPKLNISNTTLLTGSLTGIEFSPTGTINSNSGTGSKISVINAIQAAYTGSTSLASKSIYKNILDKTSNNDKILLADVVLLNKPAYVVSNVTTTQWGDIPGTNCTNDDIILSNGQTWAGCNSVLGNGLVYNANNYCYNYAGTNLGGTACYGDTTKENSYDATNGQDNIWGKLYLWADTPSACPTGWHVPTDVEFEALEITLNGNVNCRNATDGWLCAGLGWASANRTNVTPNNNIIKTLKLPLAGHWSYGTFDARGSDAYLWLSTDYVFSNARGRHLLRFYDSVHRGGRDKSSEGLSVRCIKD